MNGVTEGPSWRRRGRLAPVADLGGWRLLRGTWRTPSVRTARSTRSISRRVGLRMVGRAARRSLSQVESHYEVTPDARLPERVDLVFSLQHLPPPARSPGYFHALAGSLTPAGRVAIIDANRPGLAWLFGPHATSGDRARRKWSRPATTWSRHEFHSQAAFSGLSYET